MFLSTMSTSYSFTLSPSPRSRNLRVRLEIFPVLSRSYILKISRSSSICSILYELNSCWFSQSCFFVMVEMRLLDVLVVDLRMQRILQVYFLFSDNKVFRLIKLLNLSDHWLSRLKLIMHSSMHLVFISQVLIALRIKTSSSSISSLSRDAALGSD